MDPHASSKPEKRESIYAILSQQFFLHEVMHHLFVGYPDKKEIVTPPLAHELIDIYKCLHQAEFGVGHLINDTERFSHGLYREMLDALGSSKKTDTPMIEGISAEDRVLRIHLAPLAAGYSGDKWVLAGQLAEVCFQSAVSIQGQVQNFLESLALFRELNAAGGWPMGRYRFVFPAVWVDQFLDDVKRLTARLGQVPVFSHSERYRRLNSPAYRVVDRTVLWNSPLGSIFDKKSDHLI